MGGFTVRPTSYAGPTLTFPRTGDTWLVSSKAREPDSSIPAAVRKAFEEGQTEAREKRQIITGNIMAGFAVFKKGQIAMFTDAEGVLRQGIIMPRSFDASAEMGKQPVTFKDPAHAITFLTDAEHGHRMVMTPNKKLAITFNDGAFRFRVVRQGGKPYFLNPTVRALLGDFSGRQETFLASTTDATVARKAVAAYQDTLGASFITSGSKDEARKITGEAIPQIEKADGAKQSRRTEGAAPAANLDQRIDDARTRPNDPIVVGPAPRVLTALGAASDPVVVAPGVISKATGKHGLTLAETKAELRRIYDPVMVFDSAAESAEPADSFVVAVEVMSDGKPVVLAVHLNKSVCKTTITNIASIHRKDSASAVQRWIDEGLTRYVGKAAGRWLGRLGLHLPRAVVQRRLDGMILSHSDVFKSDQASCR